MHDDLSHLQVPSLIEQRPKGGKITFRNNLSVSNGQQPLMRNSVDKQSLSPQRPSMATQGSSVEEVMKLKNRRLVDTTAAWEALMKGHEEAEGRKSINTMIKEEKVKLEL